MTTAIEDRPAPTCDYCGKPLGAQSVIGKRGVYCNGWCSRAAGEVPER